MAAYDDEIAKEIVDEQGLNGLLNVMANMEHRPAQRAATESLLVSSPLLRNYKQGIHGSHILSFLVLY